MTTDLLPVIVGGDIGVYAIGRSFHEAYGVPENEKEREALINDILDRMNEIREKLKE